jgi:hypothetical protein
MVANSLKRNGCKDCQTSFDFSDNSKDLRGVRDFYSRVERKNEMFWMILSQFVLNLDN